MLLALDVSTSIIGYAILNSEKKLVKYGHLDLRNKNKYKNLFEKGDAVKKLLKEIKENFPIKFIYIEKILMRVNKSSSANTITVAARFNGIVNWISYQTFGIIADELVATSARKKAGLTIKRGEDAKEKCVDFVLDNVTGFVAYYTPKGNLRPSCYDEVDAIVLSYAGYKEKKHLLHS